jgi:hypothetical protein
MKILIIGNCQVYGCGLTDEEGFVEQFIKKIVRNHFFKVQVTTFVAVSLKESVELLMTLEPQLYTYDLIILQLANDELVMTESFRTILQKDKRHFLAPKDQCYHGLKTYAPSDINYFRTALADKCGMQYVEANKFANLFTFSMLKILYQVGALTRLSDINRQWKVILQLLMSVRSKVVVVSPLPSLNRHTQLLRVAGNQLVLDTCQEMEFTAIDSLNLLETHPYFFLPDGNHLNVLGHKMLANRLFQLYSKGKMVDRPSFMYQFSDN